MVADIDSRADKLIDKLTEQYRASYQRMEAMEEKLREENKSLWQRVYDATVGLIEKIIAFKDMLFGILGRVASVVGDIIKHPIRFLGNLIDAVSTGINNFVSHIGEHLKQGFMEWLFGAVAQTGIQLPKSFDLKGIVNLVMQVLGLTYANFRARAVALLGEKVVGTIETVAEVFKQLVTEGPGALWEWIKEKVGDLQAMVIEPIKTFILEKVIMAGVTWLIGLLNPASAFFKACKAIYDIVMFFVERGKQIVELVNAIIDSIASIASGAIAGAATMVENALVRAIPVVIGFLASLLGVGGISEKIKEVIEAVRKPIGAAIDWVIGKALQLVKAAGKFIGGLFGGKEEDKKDEKPKEADPEKSAKVEAGLVAIDVADQARAKDGAISREDAEAVAADVKKKHPVFTSITVVDGDGTWDYSYAASPSQVKKGLNQDIPAERHLPEDYDVRKKLYERGSGWRSKRKQFYNEEKDKIKRRVDGAIDAYNAGDEASAIRRVQQLVHEEKLHKEELSRFYSISKKSAEKKVDKIEYHVDHKYPLAGHWVDNGFNSGDKARRDKTTEESNLNLITAEANLSKGSSGEDDDSDERYHYADKFYVGRSFKSEHASARKIDGQPFKLKPTK